MKPFRLKNSSKFYFNYLTKDGKKRLKSTGTSDYSEACSFIANWVAPEDRVIIPTLLSEIRNYQKIETNPKYRQCQIDGGHYTKHYAQAVTYYSKQLESIFVEKCPIYLNKPLPEFTRRDCKELTQAIVSRYGRCRHAQILQQLTKVIFSEARQDGIIDVSPMEGQHQIKYEPKRRYAIPYEWIAWVISHPEFFMDTESWAFFTVLATTGMRRGEVLALINKQVDGNVLNIDRQIPTSSKDGEVTLPKWGIKRIIPLSKITMDALNSIDININGRYFYRPCAWVSRVFDYLKATLNGVDPQHKDLWIDMTPHVLRHSFNTNLIISKQDPMLVAEYCGWEHQGLMLDMQSRYTHFRASHMQSIADCIDELYTYKEGMLEAL